MIIQRLDGTTYDLADYGCKTLGFDISSPSPNTTIERIDGRHGHLDFGTVFDGRMITVSFYLKGKDAEDFRLLRNLLFQLTNSLESFYIIDKKESFKRWKVKLERNFNINQMGEKGLFELVFISDSPFAESIGTTLDSFTFDDELWGVGQKLTADANEYTFTTTSFSVNNASDVEIDPRETPLKITFTGASSGLQITNTTTGDTWTYTGTTQVGDVIVLNGIQSTKNGISIFGDTNRKLITLAQGWNDFTISGASSFTIEFDFRFYYL